MWPFRDHSDTDSTICSPELEPHASRIRRRETDNCTWALVMTSRSFTAPPKLRVNAYVFERWSSPSNGVPGPSTPMLEFPSPVHLNTKCTKANGTVIFVKASLRIWRVSTQRRVQLFCRMSLRIKSTSMASRLSRTMTPSP